MPRSAAAPSRLEAAALVLLAPAFTVRTALAGNADKRLPVAGIGEIPVMAYGCGGKKRDELLAAIRAGYRVFDTALWPSWGYWQTELAAAIEASGVPREDIIIESKIAPIDFGKVSTPRAINHALRELNTSYIDILVTHHMSCTDGAMCWSDWTQAWRPEQWQPDGHVADAYGAMETAVLEGRVRAIGFSNIDAATLAGVLSLPYRVKPAFVSNYFNPFYQDKEVRALCAAAGIAYQGFLLMGRNGELGHPTFQRLAALHQVGPAQIILRWALTKNVSVVASSKREDRMRENRELDFELSEEELAQIDRLEAPPPGAAAAGPRVTDSSGPMLVVLAALGVCGGLRWLRRGTGAGAKEA